MKLAISHAGLSFRGRQLLILLLLALVPLGCGLGIALYTLRHEVLSDAVQRLQTVADLKVVQVREWLSQGRDVTRLLGELQELRRMHPPPWYPTRQAVTLATLQRMVDNFVHLRTVSLLHPWTGEVVLSTDPTLVARIWRHKPCFLQGQHDLFVGPVDYSLSREMPELCIGAPLGEVIAGLPGVVLVELDLQRLADTLRQQTVLGQGGRAYLVDSYGFYVTVPPDTEGTPLRRIARNAAVSGALAGRGGHAVYQREDGEGVLGVYRWLADSRLGLVVEIPQTQYLTRIERIRRQTVAVAAVMMALILALGSYLNRRLLKPLMAIASAADALSEGDLGRRAPEPPDNDEIGRLARAFNHMADSLERSYRELHHQANHDVLTGLIARGEFQRRLGWVHRQAREERAQYVLGVLDLDHFKHVNDTAGHAAGDELLRQVTAMLLARVRGRDTLARLGGDEFGLLLEHCSLEDARVIAQSMVDALESFRFQWEDRVFRIGVSIGLSVLSSHCADVDLAMTRADMACYAAKRAGRCRVEVYHEPGERFAVADSGVAGALD